MFSLAAKPKRKESGKWPFLRCQAAIDLRDSSRAGSASASGSASTSPPLAPRKRAFEQDIGGDTEAARLDLSLRPWCWLSGFGEEPRKYFYC